MGEEYPLGPTSGLPPGTVVGAGPYAVGNRDGQYFAVSRRCRHLGADLANGSIDAEGCLVCPWHQSMYDVHTGLMVRGPQGMFAKVPGLGSAFKALTRILPLRPGEVTERAGDLYVR
jgi:nitrite reductase/ring-hydroxylating ferredoxin subunit